MTPAIWTGIYAEQPLTEALRTLAKLGWRHFELSTEHLTALAADRRRKAGVAAVRQLLAELGATMPQAHGRLGANVAHPDPAVRESDLAVLESHLACCAELGVERVVIHPGKGAGYTTRDELRAIVKLNVEAFTRLGDRAGALGLRIGLENTMDLPRHDGRHFGAYPHELLDLIAAVGNPALGITLDTSHAHCMHLDLARVVAECGDLLICTHISDNDTSGDQHRTPGTGTIEWLPVVAALRGIGYQGLFNLEIPGERHPEPALLAQKLRFACELTEWLVEL